MLNNRIRFWKEIAGPKAVSFASQRKIRAGKDGPNSFGYGALQCFLDLFNGLHRPMLFVSCPGFFGRDAGKILRTFEMEWTFMLSSVAPRPIRTGT